MLTDGRELEGRCLVMKGEPENPHSAAELEGKFMQLGAPLWGDAAARDLLAGCMALERIENFGTFADRFKL